MLKLKSFVGGEWIKGSGDAFELYKISVPWKLGCRFTL